VLVVQDGRPVLRKGYGLAEVELSVPIRPDMVFRVGSVTKQFTAACILRLVEEGRLALSDDLTKYLPDYPTGGRRVTIEQLLTHTSGIKNYTEIPARYPSRLREDWTLTQLIDFFKNAPFDFEPGTRWHYDNSGYVLLGAILEKVTGKAYADLVSDWIFTPLGMKDTRYGSEAPIIPGRVAGYQRTPGGTVNAYYLSMTQAFSAGGLVSTVDDLAKWQTALDSGAILSPESRRRMWTPVTLPDGTKTRYGFGWGIWSYEGHAVVEHGGRINGFATASMRMPDDHVYVAVLSNCLGCAETRALGLRAASILIGKPFDERRPISMPEATLEAYAGTYRDEDGDDWVVTRSGDHLAIAAGPTMEIWPDAADAFFARDAVRTFRFVRDTGGAVVALEIDEGMAPVTRATRRPKTD
jgi:CubicO group peptidase (beta-lactamase class C family)